MVNRPELRPLTLPLAAFDAIARGELSQPVAELLRPAERGRRLLLLQHVIYTLRHSPGLLGPLGALDAALAVLDAAGEKSPHAVEEVLAYPQTGMWVSYAIRRLTGSAEGHEPLWACLGHLNAVCAAAAVRAGLDSRVPVPMIHRDIFLPTLGRARIGRHPRKGRADGAPFGIAWVHALGTPGRFRVEDGADGGIDIGPDACRESAPESQWLPVRRVEAVAPSGSTLAVTLDHVDPYPAQVGLAGVERLPDSVAQEWSARLIEAWRLLDDDHPAEARTLAAGLTSLIPLEPRAHGVLAGSSGDGFGAAAIVLPPSAVDLACLLVHEFRHSALNALLHLVDLCEPGDDGRRYYAPWRDDPRPVLGLLHGAFAFTAVTAFWRRRRVTGTGGSEGRAAAFEFAVWRLQTARVLGDLSRSHRLTSLGERLVRALRNDISAALREPVTADVQRLAVLTADAHRAGWRAHHVQPCKQWVAEAVKRIGQGRTAPVGRVPSDVVADPAARCLNEFFSRAKEYLVSARDPADHPGDLLLSGDSSGALQGYLDRISSDASDTRPWAMLGVCLSATGSVDPADVAAARVLRQHPERVRAVHLAGASGDGDQRSATGDGFSRASGPVAVARWLAAAGA